MAKQKKDDREYWAAADLPAAHKLRNAIEEFARLLAPLEGLDRLLVLRDARTKALYCECHLKASTFIPLSTTDVPLDPKRQVGYRANREIVADHDAYQKMLRDAKQRRSFSNIVAEFTSEFDSDHPLKIVGGQHRFLAIEEALASNVDKYHGFKVYFQLTKSQRLDAQLISNTTIAISKDLLDRMEETFRGPGLRQWAQATGFLGAGQDFSDKRSRARPVTVQFVRTFFLNYMRGKEVPAHRFEHTDTTPTLCPAGKGVTDWSELVRKHPDLFKDEALREAGTAFIDLVTAQRRAVGSWKPKPGPPDYAEKGLHLAVMAGWAFVAGCLQSNPTRLKRHYALKDASGRDPLNADALAKGRHKSDTDSYRGLGYRTNAKEMGRFAELFYLQAEKGQGITTQLVGLAIKKYHAKQAVLDVQKAEGEK